MTTIGEGGGGEAIPVEEVAMLFNKGSFVELHSLSRDDMNGKTGEVLGFDTSAERYMVKLDNENNKSIKVKPVNCRRVALQPESIRRQAYEKALEGFRTVPPTEARFHEALAIDRCCVKAHVGLGELATRQGKPNLVHMHRALAHMFAYEQFMEKLQILRTQMEYSTCLGEAGDLEGEAEWLEKVLEQAPQYCHAIMGKAANFHCRGLHEQSWDAWCTVLECPDEDPLDIITAQQVARVKQLSRQNAVREVSILTHRTNLESAETRKCFQHALAMCNRILSTTGLDPDNQIKLLALKGFLLAHESVVLKKNDSSWEDGQNCFREARFVQTASPLIQSMILFWQARAYELRGDYCNTEASSSSSSQDADYAEAMSLLRESEQVHTDAGTRGCYLRLQAKTNPNLAPIIEPSSGTVVATPIGGNVVLEQLPQGPTHPLPERERPPNGVNIM